MFKQISILLLICFASLSAFAQTEKYTVPVRWERYKVSDKKVSVLMPKLPVFDEVTDICSQQTTKRFAAYSDQTVYGFTVTSRMKEKISYICPSQQKFNDKSFQRRLAEIKDELKEAKETSFVLNKITFDKISDKSSRYWLVNDFKNDRWFEFWVVGENEEKPEIKNFIESIEINKQAQGTEIGDGSIRALGDEKKAEISEEQSDSTKSGKLISVVAAFKPQPKYTDEARRANIQGTVTLRVTFYANGGVGSISPATTLPYGLTEQAIFAAQRIVFIPAKRNGVSVTVSKAISYNFLSY